MKLTGAAFGIGLVGAVLAVVDTVAEKVRADAELIELAAKVLARVL